MKSCPEKQKEVVFKCCIEGKLYRETAPRNANLGKYGENSFVEGNEVFPSRITGRYSFAFHAGEASFEIKKSFLEKSCFLLSPVFYGSLYCVKTIIDDRVYTRRL